MGGFLAQRVAAECPSLVAKAVFVTSAPPAGILLQGSVLWRMAQPYVAGAMLRKTELQIRWGDARALELNCMSEEDARSAFDRLVPESGLAARQLANPFFGWVDPAKLSCPTMVVAASKDKMLPPAVQRAIARRYGSEYWEYSGGHMLPIEQHWEVPLPDILRFINT
jgi:pimeloyl-ACP methyl ester carboxylesterase